MSIPVLFGRSWDLSLNLTDSQSGKVHRKAFQLSILITRPVDPLSGMTVNLVTVDQWFKGLDSLIAFNHREPLSFLSEAHRLIKIFAQETQTEVLKIELLDMDQDGFSIQSDKTYYHYRIGFQENLNNVVQDRQIDIISTLKMSSTDRLSLRQKLEGGVHVQKTLDEDNRLVQIKLWDIFNSKIEGIFSGKHKNIVY